MSYRVVILFTGHLRLLYYVTQCVPAPPRLKLAAPRCSVSRSKMAVAGQTKLDFSDKIVSKYDNVELIEVVRNECF